MNRYIAKMNGSGNDDDLLNKIHLSKTAFSAFFEKLNEHDIRYLITGHLAAAYYGFAKTSDNIEIWVHPDDMEKLNEILNVSSKRYNMCENKSVTSKGGEFALSPLTDLFYFTAKDFARCYSRTTLAPFFQVTLPIINIDDLIIEKLASSSPEDLMISRELEKIKKLNNQ